MLYALKQPLCTSDCDLTLCKILQLKWTNLILYYMYLLIILRRKPLIVAEELHMLYIVLIVVSTIKVYFENNALHLCIIHMK